MRVMVVGGVSVDHVARGPQIAGVGRPVTGEWYRRRPGGKGANAAVTARRLGMPASLLGRVGNDEAGLFMAESLAAERVDTQGLRRDPRYPTGAALLMLDESGRTASMGVPGANAMTDPADAARDGAALDEVTAVLASFEVPVEAVSAAVRAVSRPDPPPIVLDLTPPGVEVPDGLLRAATLVRLGQEDAASVVGSELDDLDAARRAVARLQGRGAPAVSVELPDGDLVATPDGENVVPHLPVRRVDSIGAGDAAAAASAVALALGGSMLTAACLASIVASFVVERDGAWSGPTMAEAHDRLDAAAGDGWPAVR